jgi:ribonuclease R
MLLLRTLKQAVYDTHNVGHFGLASANYLHFTSPIRRYPDVQVHRAVKGLLRGGKPDTDAAALQALAQSASAASTRERASMEVEREVVDLYRALLMRDRIGQSFEGTITALVGSGAYVTLLEPFVDVLVRFESMGPDRYEISDDELSIVGTRSGDTIALGDPIVVTIEDVAVLRRTVYARRVIPEKVLAALESGDRSPKRGRGKQEVGRPRPGSGAGSRMQPRLKVHHRGPQGKAKESRSAKPAGRAERGRGKKRR